MRAFVLAKNLASRGAIEYKNRNTQQTPQKPQTSSQSKVSNAQLCQFGQELVQELVQKAQDTFSLCKGISLPNGQIQARRMYDDRLKRLKENAEGMAGPNGLMGKLEKIYQIVNDSQPEVTLEQIVSCLALKDDDRIGNKEIGNNCGNKNKAKTSENKSENNGENNDQGENSGENSEGNDNISDYHKGLIKQRDELRNKLADRNRALLEIMHQYRELMMELNSLTWPTK